MMASAGKVLHTLIIVENLPVPFDRRVWQEATTLHDAGYEVSIICPTGKGYEKRFEVINGINIYRHPLPLEGHGFRGYILEYSAALYWQMRLAWQIWRKKRFDVIHACNPPDNIFFVALPFKALFGVRFLFDHHDICPELYEAKFGQKGMMWKMMLLWERLTFKVADISIATNESYKRIAIERGKQSPEKVFVVRSGPSIERMQRLSADASLKNGRRYLVGYVGVMGQQEGIHLLLHAAHHIIYDIGRRDIQFGLVGGGTQLCEMQQLAHNLGLDDFVSFTGRVSDEEMLAMLNTATVCVNPDIYNPMNDKSTMNKIMEYMALGKPIVQFDLTEGRFSAQKASLYARPNDTDDMANKILQLLDDPILCQQMGEYGYRRVIDELEWRHEVPKLLAAYEALWEGSHKDEDSHVSGTEKLN